MPVVTTVSTGREKTMRRFRARPYRFRIEGHPWMTFIGPVRNREEATQMLRAIFGECLSEVRLSAARCYMSLKAGHRERTAR